MSGYKRHEFEIPEETKKVAKAAFPKGNENLRIRDELGEIFKDEEFAQLYELRGQEGESPALLALVTVLGYKEGLTDRQAAEAVRGRIDWKYALGLELTDSGFHHSVLGKFRERLLEGGKEGILFDKVLEKLKEVGLVEGKKQQRTDATHVIAAIRKVNKLEGLGEALRRVLDAVAKEEPEWLVAQIDEGWFKRYGKRIEDYRLAKEKTKRIALQKQIGEDGHKLMRAIYSPQAPPRLRELKAVEVMRQMWIQQFYIEEGEVRCREKDNIPPFKQLIVSPDDVEARNRTKRDCNWSGYAVHLTETCELSKPHLVTNVLTTPATTADVEVTATIHQALAAKDLLPQEHLVDTAYVSVDHLLNSQQSYNVDLLGPVGGGRSWQAKADKGFDIQCFAVDWASKTVTCPQGKTTQNWKLRRDKHKHQFFAVSFKADDCCSCPCLADCTRSKKGYRILHLKPQLEYETLRHARQRQSTPAFKQVYNKRAGIEGTISQATRSFGLRRSRYIGLAKTHLQHLATAAAINLSRAVSWLNGEQLSPFSRLSPFSALSRPT